MKNQLGGTVHTLPWLWQGQALTITYETLGAGAPVLLLPALSTVSNRAELAQLAIALAPHFQVTVLDWPGFGDSSRLRLTYEPSLFRQFLHDFVLSVFTILPAVIAAGHAAGYALGVAVQPGPNRVAWRKFVLVAPTWRGPLAVMGAPATLRQGVRSLVRSPVIGQFLYGLNTRPSFLKWMYRRHVFVDETKLTPDYIQQRYQGTQQTGARFAPAAFVTGGLDPAHSREEFLRSFEGLDTPVMVVLAEQAPPASKADMTAIANLPTVQVLSMVGSLGVAEEQ